MAEQESKYSDENKQKTTAPKFGLNLTTTQNGYTFLLTLAAGATGTLESLPGVQCSIDFNLSVYGNLDKNIQYEVSRYTNCKPYYDENSQEQLPLNELYYRTETYVDNFKQTKYKVNTAGNQSWFGPIDASISVGGAS